MSREFEDTALSAKRGGQRPALADDTAASEPEVMRQPSRPVYPPAYRAEIVDVLHGIEVEDPYRWLEDRTDAATAHWIQAQAELLDAAKATWGTHAYWRERLETLMGAGSISPPVWRGDRQFRMRRQPGQEHAVLVVIEADGGERVLLDPAELDPTGVTTLDSWQPDKQGRRLAYQLSVGGNEESAVYVLDVDSGEILDGPIDRARYSAIAWLVDGSGYYYVRRLAPELVPHGEEQFHRRVWLHQVGEDPNKDIMIFGEGRKATEYFGVSLSRDGRWLTISASEGTAPRNDIWVADMTTCDLAAPQLRPLRVGVDAHTSIHFGRDERAYIYTDFEAARGQLRLAEFSDLSIETSSVLIAERDDAVLNGYTILDGEELSQPIMIVGWTKHAVAELTIHDLQSGARIGSIELPGIGTVGGLRCHPDGGHEAWFVYTDYATIPRVMVYDALTGTLQVDAYPPGFVEVPKISSTIHTYRSKDGTEVRLMLLSPTDDTDRTGASSRRPRPTVLYGYGGFGVSMAPAYSPSILSWVEAGGVYAVACLRGGAEEGEAWHRAGMLGNKQNVFDDFIGAAGYLIDNNWTTPDQLVISGGSNGGLLVGAVMTQRPDLFAGVHCSAPLLDMVRYELFGLGATWNVEYGSASDPEQFSWLYDYSPYHHVEPGVDYPATLFTVFDQDTRVDPMHARKMCAALQHATAAPRPVLIRSEADVGHGARSVSRSLELSADVLAFMAHTTGLNPPAAAVDSPVDRDSSPATPGDERR